MLQIRLLGQFDIRVDGKRVTIPSRAGQSLFAYFVLTAGTLHRREKLAGMFWPDASEESARKNLRNELWRIRKAISAQQPATVNYLLADEFTITFSRNVEYWLDVAQLEGSALDLQSLRSNLALYQGELLPGFYDDWIVLERGRIQSIFDSKMEQLLGQLITAERWTMVQEQAERWLSLGSALEPAYRALLLAYGARGDMAKVSSIYQRCIEELDEQFGLEPSAETRALYDGLLKGAQVSPRTVQSPGTVTFLFTDIERSTDLLDKLREQYATVLAEHHKILRAATQKWNGRELDTQGDAFFVTFTRAMDAVQCAADAQRALASHSWPHHEPLRVRMGLHTGEPLIASTGYVGMGVHRAARIGDAAHGGQVLLSQTTRDLISHDLPKGMTIQDLGEHRLKDLKYPTPIFQLVIEGLSHEFPPLRTKFSDSEAPAPGEPPFKGLQYFEEADSNLFFGRELLTAKLISRLNNTQFLSVIIGASGSGKSSLVRAGLIPALKKGDPLVDGSKPPEGSTNWRIHVITPTVHPLEALAIELTRDSESATAATLMDDLMQDPRSLSFFLAHQDAQRHTLLVIDQFEELFTLCHDEFERESFIDNLLTTLNQDEGNITLILTLRADFYAHLAQYPELRDAVARQQEYIGPMTMEELRRAIEEPAKRGQWVFEPGLVDLILRDVGDEPGALPLLSHALLETWKRRAGYTLTLKGYADAGGVRGAIAHTAETVYQNLSSAEQVIARDIFLRLTELGEGTEDTRRRATLDELMSSPENADERSEVRTVLNLLADARLITLGENTAEVAHEALIREWPTLREWLNQDREGLLLHRHLTEATYEWELLGRDPGALYRGAHLTQAREWAALHPRALNVGEKVFLDASNELEQNEIAEHEAQQRRELEAAQKLAETESARAEEQTRSANRLRARNRVITMVGAITMVLAVLAGIFGIQSNRNAVQAETNLGIANQERAVALSSQSTAIAESQVRATQQSIAESNFQQAESQRLGAEGLALAQSSDGNAEIAVLLGIRGLQTVYSPQADAALQLAVPQLYTQRIFQRDIGAVGGLALSPDGKTLFSTDLKLRDTASGEVIYDLLPRTNGAWATQVAFSPDGEWALSGHFDNTARLWDVQTGRLLRVLSGHTDWVNGIAFSPDGKWVVSGSSDKIARLWDAATGQEVRAFKGHTSAIESVAFSPDGKQVLTGSWDQTARLWDVSTGQTVRIFQGRMSEVFVVAFSSNGSEILTGSADSTVLLWNTATGQELRQFEGHKGPVRSVTFSSDGKWVLTAGVDHTARLWDTATGEMLRVFSGHTNVVGSAVFAPDGQSVYTGSWDQTIRQWKLGSDERVFTTPDGWGYGVFSADGQSVYLLGSEGQLAWFADARSGRELARFSGHTDTIASLVISNDRKYVLTGSFDKTARLWDARTGQELRIFNGHTGTVNAIFSHDGKLVLTYSEDKTARMWDAATGRLLQAFRFNSPVIEAVISPDNKFVLTTEGGTFSFMMWDIQSGKLIHVFNLAGSQSGITDLDVSRDGKYLLSGLEGGDMDKTVLLWDASTYKFVRSFAHPNIVIGAAFSENGQFIWTTSADGKVRQWGVGTGELVRVFTGLFSDLSPDEKFVLIGAEEQAVHLYDVNYHDTIRYACSRLLRDLTLDELHVYNIKNRGPTCPKT